MVHQIIDLTTAYNANAANVAVQEVGGFDYAVLQIVGPSAGTITFQATNDAGAVQGETDGNAGLATNFVSLFGTNVSTGVGAATTTAAGIWRFDFPPKFIRLNKSSNSMTATKVLLMLRKIS